MKTPEPLAERAVSEPVPAWAELARLTPARVALGRSGVSLPTREVLSFGLAHARARDAVHQALDVVQLRRELEADGWTVLDAASQAQDRAAFLARPDWGRRLDESSRARLASDSSGFAGGRELQFDLALVLGDGLSAAAVHQHVQPLLRALRPKLAHLRLAPLVIATQARVALADEIGERLGAGLAAILIGERPGLSSPDSLGIYLTADPRPGRVDAERWCISNIHAAGLGYEEAAGQLLALIDSARRTGRTGVVLPSPGDPFAPALQGPARSSTRTSSKSPK